MSVSNPKASAREASVGSAIRLSAEIVVRTSSVIATLWLTRTLGVSGYGSFILALSIGLVVAELSDLGLSAVVVPLVVRSRQNLRTIFLMKAAMTLGVSALAVLLLPLASRASGLDLGILGLCAFHFLCVDWIVIMGAALRALGRRLTEAFLLLVFRFSLVGLVIAAPFGESVSGAALSYAASVVPAVLLGMVLIGRGPRLEDSSLRATVGGIVAQAFPMGVNGYLAILSSRVELFLLQAFFGAHIVGLFGGAVRIVESLLTLPAAVASGALPSVARDVVQGSKGAAQRTFGAIVWIAAPAALGLALCAPDVLRVLGPGFVEGAGALRILSVALFVCFANTALSHLLIAAGNTAVIPRLTGARVMVAALLGALLIPALGLRGAALSFTAAEIVLFGALVSEVRGPVALEVARPVGFAFLACVPMFVVLSFWPLPLVASILTGALLFLVAGFLILRHGTEASGLA